jgi:hypothetical protein
MQEMLEDANAEIKRLRAEVAKKVLLHCWKCSDILAIPLCRECAAKEVRGDD